MLNANANTQSNLNDPAPQRKEIKPEQKGKFRLDFRQYSLLIAILAIFVIFTIATDGSFVTSRNLSNLFRQMSVTGILAIGMTLVIVAGHIDLSVGSLVGLTGGIAAILHVWYDWNTFAAIGIALILGVILGAVQGWWIAYKNVPAFIVTLGGMMVFRGILIGVSNGETIAPLQDNFKMIGQGYIPYTVGYIIAVIVVAALFALYFKNRVKKIKLGLPLGNENAAYGRVALFSIVFLLFVYMMNRYLGIPAPIMAVLVVAGIFIFLSQRTTFGRHVYVIGGNADAAKYSGIKIKRNVLIVYMLMGLLAGIAGVLLTSRLNAATVGAGNMLELDSIAAVVIGGTSLMGGVGTIMGSIIGALIMVSIDNGMSMMNIEPFWQYIVKGSILVIAVWMDVSTKKKQ
ncbi:sugar ABC transporter permease [Fictibacillus enclensis]|uniref:sugar ABC transporter permease n=1 Tax=Fictibacillus enclensis TaxID=1017270 RepID=UPI0024C04612|nr:sugar ABC transporter permease [Fictibacillus enclensis]WHY72022.1 sugar ABC transporter permease [Fictibacillus enclensis]